MEGLTREPLYATALIPLPGPHKVQEMSLLMSPGSQPARVLAPSEGKGMGPSRLAETKQDRRTDVAVQHF